MSIAGNADHYSLALVPPSSLDALRADGISTFIRLDRVTSVIGKTLGKDGALMGWAYGIGLDAGLDAVASGLDLSGWSREQLKSYAKDRGISPWSKRDSAASRGTDAHAVAELFATGREEEARATAAALPDEVRGYAEAAIAYLEAEAAEVVAAEAALWALAHRFAGTIDLVLRDASGGIIAADFKTSKKVYESHSLQLGAYAIALEEMNFGNVTGGAIVLLREDGTYERVDVEPLPDAFLALLTVYRALRQKEGDER